MWKTSIRATTKLTSYYSTQFVFTPSSLVAGAGIGAAFSFISAHIAVTSNGGVFWQTILAENALQAALGQRNKVSIESVGSVTSQDCGNEDADSALSDECDLNSLHVVLDANVKVIDQNDTKLKKVAKFKTMSNSFDKKVLEEAPWFI